MNSAARLVVLVAAASVRAFPVCPVVPPDSKLSLTERNDAFRRALQTCPNDAALYAGLASLLIAQHDFAGALPVTQRGLRLSPRDPLLRMRQGEALIALGKAKDGLAALALAPVDGESQFFRGLAYQQLGEHPEARDCFQDAWSRGHDDPFVLYSLIREEHELGDKAAGLDHFRQMITHFPDSAWVHVLLGDAHFQKSEEPQAREEYLAALELVPDLFEANFRLAYLAFEAGQNAAAIDYYRSALAAKPHHTEANIYLGEALRRDHRYDEAITQLRRALAMDGRSALAYDSLGKALVDSHRLSEAAAILNTAEKAFPDNSSFPAMRSRILTQLGRKAEARQDAARAAALIAEKNQKANVVRP